MAVGTNETDAGSGPEASEAPEGEVVANRNSNSAHNGENSEEAEQNSDDAMFPVFILLPHDNHKLQVLVSPQEQVNEVRQSIIELPEAAQYSCFHLEFRGERVNDYVQISEVKELGADSELRLVEAPYTEKEARIHMVRMREMIGAAGDRTDTIQGLLSGLSLYDDVTAGDAEVVEVQKDPKDVNGLKKVNQVEEYDFTEFPTHTKILPKEVESPPKTVKGISLSAWNPPPVSWRQKGHLLYLVVTTNEGEQHQITAHVGGFFVNKSSNSKFDPTPRASPKAHAAHSLLTLIDDISPSFEASFKQLQDYNSRKDPLATFQIGNTLPSAPWMVPSLSSNCCAHFPDMTRTQETFLLAGAESMESLRDWNEEFQTARELPKDTVHDRVFRERLLAKIFAEYNEAAARGAVLVARGEVPPMNPTEGPDAQIFVYNNVFYSFGADGVGTFTSEGGDEAARVATGKDVVGVKLVNQLDVDGLYTPCTVVVDYLGRRIVGQSIVPGIFKQPEEGENQIQYGAVDGKDVVAADERFAAPFEKLAQAFKVKKHSVWDKEKKRHDLEASVEMKGLFGADGRKYVLDLYRISPVDIAWIEDKAPVEGFEYPHRMTVLRSELVESLHRHKAREYVNAELMKRGILKKTAANEDEASRDGKESAAALQVDENGDTKAKGETQAEGLVVAAPTTSGKEDKEDKIDTKNFKFALNPDVFSGQEPQTVEEKREWARDEDEVRKACEFLRDTVIPGLLHDLKESEIAFPMDGRSLSRLLHRRGINIRYIGKIATLSQGTSCLQCLSDLCVREMIARSFKHLASKYLRYLPLPLTSAGIAHLLNCLLGAGLNPKPTADTDETLRSLYNEVELGFEKVAPETLREEIRQQTVQRYRFVLADNWWKKLNHLQMLREVSLKLGLQLQSKKFLFAPAPEGEAPDAVRPALESLCPPNVHANGDAASKKKRKKARDASPASVASTTAVPHTFGVDDIVNVVPIVKESSPRSTLAEEALEAGRISIQNGQEKLGQELLVESLSLHEQIYGLLHPEVAQVYHALSQLYSQLDEKEFAVELARKSVIVAERTMGVDSAETVLYYLNLSLFLYQLGDTKKALVYVRHALGLWKLVFGPDHPDTITTLNNAAVMLQQLKAFHESRRWFEESLRICEKVFGKQSIKSATLQFQLAQALVLDRESKAAVSRMKESYNIFLAVLGPDDKNTKEAENWLDQLTQNAVTIAKQTKDKEARDLRRGYRFQPRNSIADAVTKAPGTATPPANNFPPHLDQRSIDELIKFIEGTDKQKKPSKKRAGRSNPQRRGTHSTTA